MNDPDRELAKQLSAARVLPLVAHLVLFTVLATLVWSHVPHRLVLAWGGAIFGLSLLRPVLLEAARRRHLSTNAITHIARFTMLALGLTWGIGGAAIIRLLSPSDAALVLLGMTGLLAGGLATLVADRWTFPIYSLAMFTPLAIVLATVDSELFNRLVVVLMLIFIAFTIRLHYRSHTALRNQLRVENELRNRERQLAAAQEIAHVGSWEWDIPANLVTWSDELRRMYGVAPDAPAGYAEFLERAHPDDRTRLEALVAQTLATRRPVEYEWRCVRPNGEVRHILGRNVVVTNAAGQAVRMAGTSFDITDRRLADENQRTLLRELQKAVAEVKVLQGILPICASCKRIKAEDGTWEQVESYVRDHSNAQFSHGLCPDCAARDWGATPSKA